MNRKTTIIAAILLLAVVAVGIFMVNRQNNLEAHNEQLELKVDSLLEEKATLLAEIDELQLAFEKEQSRADSVTELLTMTQEKIAKAAAFKAKQTRDAETLKKEIEQLRQLKSDSESLVAQLREENGRLLAQNAELTEAVGQMQTENEGLTEQNLVLENTNEKLAKTVANLKAASVKASNFQVEVGKKSGKQTAKSNKAKAINVSFDMANVPAEHHGNTTLYMVISDENGTPVKADNPVRARINAEGKVTEIEAQQAQKVNLKANQRFTFEQALNEKMKAGKYKVTIFSEMGLLGSANFVLS